MQSKTIVVDVPPGVGRVCITVWPADEEKPNGWEEIAVAERGTSRWVPAEMAQAAYEVQDHRGTVLRSSEAAA